LKSYGPGYAGSGGRAVGLRPLAAKNPPLPCDLADLKARIIAAMKNIDAPMLTRVWQELEYRIDVCRVTRGAHIEHLYLSKKNFSFLVAVNNSTKVGPLVFLL
jgi:hypothetical protein